MPIESIFVTLAEAAYLNVDMCKFESLQKRRKWSPVG